MTFTVLARCADPQLLGLALSTSALGVASRCPQINGSVAAVSAQAGTDWRLSVLALRLSTAGLEPTQVLRVLEETDAHFAHRQVGLVDQHGRAAAHTGAATKEHHAHIVGDGFVVMGNNLAGPGVVAEMAAAYEAGGDLDLEERLVRTLECGRDAGGGRRGQLSAGLVVAGPSSDRPRTDLRVDLASEPGGDAVHDLRRLYDAYRPLTDYYQTFWPDHPEVDSQNWLATQRHAR